MAGPNSVSPIYEEPGSGQRELVGNVDAASLERELVSL